MLLPSLRGLWVREGIKTEQGLWKTERAEVVDQHSLGSSQTAEGRKERQGPFSLQLSHSQRRARSGDSLQWATSNPQMRLKNSDSVGGGISTKSTHSLSLNVSRGSLHGTVERKQSWEGIPKARTQVKAVTLTTVTWLYYIHPVQSIE